MAGISRRAGVFAFGKQAAVGTALAVPGGGLGTGSGASKTFALPMVSGGMGAVRDMGDLALTAPTSGRRGRFVQRARGEGSVTILAHPEALGALLYNICGTRATSGAGPYEHKFTVNEVLPAPLTVWLQVGDAWERFIDTYITRLAINGSSGENVMVEMNLTSFDAEEPFTPSPSTLTMTDHQPRFKYLGSSILMDSDGNAVAEMTNVENVSIELDRAHEYRYGSKLTPQLAIPDRTANFSAGIVYDSAQQGWDYYRVATRGIRTGGLISNELVAQNLLYGAFDVVFGRHPTSPSSPASVAATASQVGNLATFTATSHGVVEGQSFTITGMTPSGYNGTWIAASAPTSSTLTANLSASSLGAGTGGTLTQGLDRFLRVISGPGTGTGVPDSPSAQWDYSVDRPQPDPGGGPLEMDIAGPVISDANGTTELTYILVNDTAGTDY